MLLVLKSKAKAAGLGTWLAIRPKARVSPIQVNGAQQQGELRVACQAITVVFRLGFELESPDVEAIEVNVVKRAHVGGPIRSPGRGSATGNERHQTYKGQQNAHHDAASTRPSMTTQTPASWSQASRFCVISVSRPRYGPGVKILETGMLVLAQGLDGIVFWYRTAAQWTYPRENKSRAQEEYPP